MISGRWKVVSGREKKPRMDTNEHEWGIVGKCRQRKFEEILEIIGVFGGNAAVGEWEFPAGVRAEAIFHCVLWASQARHEGVSP